MDNIDFREFSGSTTNTTLSNYGTMNIKELFLIGIPYGYQPMIRRSFMINNLNHETLNRFEVAVGEDMETGGKISPLTIAKNIGNMVSLRSYSGENSIIQMPNGWSEPRFRFILVVEVKVGPATRRYFIQGYTDYYGFGQGCSLDDNMSLFINSITDIDMNFNHRSRRMDTRLGETYNTLRDYSAYVDNEMSKYVSIRPLDIMNMNSAITSMSFEDGNKYPGSFDIYGFGEYNNNQTITSSRKNSDPNVYMSRLINGYIEGQNIASTSYDSCGVGQEIVYRSAAQSVPEPILAQNTFIRKIQEVTGQLSPTSLRLGDLYRIDPTLFGDNSRIQVFENNDQGYAIKTDNYFNAGNEYVSSTIEPTFRNIRILEINNSITSNLVSCGLAKAFFNITAFLGQGFINVIEAKSLLGDDKVPECVERFKSIVRNIVIPYITRGDIAELDIAIDADITKDTTIVVSRFNDDIGHVEKEIFRFPTFADALYSPMICSKEERMTFNRDFETITQSI